MNAMGILALCLSIVLTTPPSHTATWYGREDGFHGRLMANGQVFDADVPSAASNQFRLGTQLVICSVEKCIPVEVTDRMSQSIRGNQLDLSSGAFELLAPKSRGVLQVWVFESDELLEIRRKLLLEAIYNPHGI